MQVRKILISNIFFLALLGAQSVWAQESALKITPSKCVALKKGRICYQSLRIQFTPSTTSDFCLKVSDQSEPLECWSNSKAVDFKYRFASSTDLTFEIIDMSNQTLSSATFAVAWVYKQSRKKNRWRLF